jgi:hypothetical protein
MDRYTSEVISFMDNGVFTLGNTELSYLLSNIFSKLPCTIVDDIYDHCLIVMSDKNQPGRFIPSRLLKNKNVILLSEVMYQECLIKDDMSEFINLVLLEVAHYRLKHKNPILDNLNEEQQKKQDDEAGNLAREWLSMYNINDGDVEHL